jgi:hypothetical protein
MYRKIPAVTSCTDVDVLRFLGHFGRTIDTRYGTNLKNVAAAKKTEKRLQIWSPLNVFRYIHTALCSINRRTLGVSASTTEYHSFRAIQPNTIGGAEGFMRNSGCEANATDRRPNAVSIIATGRSKYRRIPCSFG